MCGFAGFWTLNGWDRSGHDTLRAMADAVRHRGPDDEGYWADPDVGVGFGHRRLAIIDLSPEGRQPMRSVSGRYCIAYNGEIYNCHALRRTLEGAGVAFRGHSDTEVMLAAVERWGLEGAVERFEGMFAFALWDAAERTLLLVRDRLGEKPLYYGAIAGTLLFGSELKALRMHPAWRGDINRAALGLYLRHGYIPSPYSIYQHIRKVEPGTIVTARLGHSGLDTRECRYWSAREAVERGRLSPLVGSEADAVEACDVLLRDVIRKEMVADVPLGAFLSGGVDSSTVVALMQAQSRRPVRTFTIGFHEGECNEADHAKAVAAHLGTEHTELYVTGSDMLSVIPQLPLLYDEPFADSSQIPTLLVAQMTRRHVTVSLSGDGGDELFGGYTRYTQGARIWDTLRRWPIPIRRAVSAALAMLPSEPDWADRLHKGARLLRARTIPAMYRELMSQFAEPSLIAPESVEAATVFTTRDGVALSPQCIPGMMYLDLISYLPDDILVKVDRASMQVSLESRAPFLHHEVVEFACRVPLQFKIRQGQSKWLIRRVLDRYLPTHLIDRPKRGFGIPLRTWLAGPLRDWAEALLRPARLRQQGFLNPSAVTQLWASHSRGARRVQDRLWTVLMLQAWLDAEGVSSVPAARPSGGVAAVRGVNLDGAQVLGCGA
jgi:asparagine synthase (glutamine-hydrolysing)